MNPDTIVSFLVQGGSLAVLAVLILYVGPRMMDRRVEAVEQLADKWAADREKDRAEHARQVAELVRAVEAAATRIAYALAGRHPPEDHHG